MQDLRICLDRLHQSDFGSTESTSEELLKLRMPLLNLKSTHREKALALNQMKEKLSLKRNDCDDALLDLQNLEARKSFLERKVDEMKSDTPLHESIEMIGEEEYLKAQNNEPENLEEHKINSDDVYASRLKDELKKRKMAAKQLQDKQTFRKETEKLRRANQQALYQLKQTLEGLNQKCQHLKTERR